MSHPEVPGTEHDYDTAEGVRLAIRAAKTGDTAAAETLARRLSYIIAGDSDFTDAELDELITAAEAGWNAILSHPECHPDDMYQYAMDILWDDEGEVIADNASDGAAWMLRAAERNHADAQLEIGRLYLDGTGVPRSLVIATEWFTKAAGDELNAEHAKYFLSEIKKHPAKKPAAKKDGAKKAPAKKSAKAPATKKTSVKKPVAKSVVKKAPAGKAKSPVAKTKVVVKKAGASAKPAKAAAKKTKPATKAKVAKAKPIAKKTAPKSVKKKAPSKRK